MPEQLFGDPIVALLDAADGPAFTVESASPILSAQTIHEGSLGAGATGSRLRAAKFRCFVGCIKVKCRQYGV